MTRHTLRLIFQVDCKVVGINVNATKFVLSRVFSDLSGHQDGTQFLNQRKKRSDLCLKLMASFGKFVNAFTIIFSNWPT